MLAGHSTSVKRHLSLTSLIADFARDVVAERGFPGVTEAERNVAGGRVAGDCSRLRERFQHRRGLGVGHAVVALGPVLHLESGDHAHRSFVELAVARDLEAMAEQLVLEPLDFRPRELRARVDLALRRDVAVAEILPGAARTPGKPPERVRLTPSLASVLLTREIFASRDQAQRERPRRRFGIRSTAPRTSKCGEGHGDVAHSTSGCRDRFLVPWPPWSVHGAAGPRASRHG